MHLFPVMVLGACVVVTAAQPMCDTRTQYKLNDQCCKMCDPGTAMADSDCKAPRCEECKENEYQESYTKESKCEAQPYCDPHKNFEVAGPPSKTKKRTCVCRPGFHCSTDACVSCVAHTACKPGSGVVSEGDHSSDTVCQPCEKGSFSNVTSWSSKCIKWTECEPGYRVSEEGTDKSDNICETRNHVHLGIILSVLGFTALVVALVCCGYRRNVQNKKKHRFPDDSHHEEQNGTLITIEPNEMITPEQETTREEGSSHVPEENLDEGIQWPENVTDNGNFVVQERGKSEIISRQESQTCTIVDSYCEE